MRSFISTSVVLVAVMAGARPIMAQAFEPTQFTAPAVIAYYGTQPQLVASYPVYGGAGFYYNWPAIGGISYKLAVDEGSGPIRFADPFMVSNWVAVAPRQEIYYTAPPTPPGMADAPLGVMAEGKQSTMLR